MVNWSSDSSRVPPEQQIRDSLIRSMEANGATPSRFLELLDAVTKDGVWRKLKDRHGRPFTTFTQFVVTERPEGLGLHDKDDLEKHLALEHKEEREPYRRVATVERMTEMRQRVKSLLYEETNPERPVGRPRNGEENLRDTKVKPETDTSEYIVARLKRDAEHDQAAADLAAKVISGEITPNAAAREKGWRKPRVVVSSPERIAGSLRKHMPREALLRLAELLTKED